MDEHAIEGTDGTKPRDIVASVVARPSTRWIVLSLVAAAVLGTAVYSYRQIDSELTAVALSRREAVAQLAAAILAEKFGRIVDTGISLATRVRFRELVAEGRWAEAIEIMRAVPRDLPYIERLFLTDTKGTLQADVPALPGVRGANFASHEWFGGVSSDWRPYVSSVYKRIAVPRLNVFAVAVPVKNGTGSVAGILVLHIRVESLLEWIKTVDTEAGGVHLHRRFEGTARVSFQAAELGRHHGPVEVTGRAENAVERAWRRGRV